MARDEFSSETKRRLAQRAGYLCSICNCLTIGPSDEGENSVNLIGKAAHISGASSGKGSRRHDPDMSSEQRSSIENGIWLCATHADLIDRDESTYTTFYLKLIKKNHEKKIQFKQSGIDVEKGIITKITASNLGQVTEPIEMEFGDRNLILGNNGVGKTMICEFLAGLVNKKYLNRWTKRDTKVNSYFSIEYFKNRPENFVISIDYQNKISYSHNGSPIPILAPPLKVFYLGQSFNEFNKYLKDSEKKSFLEKLALYFKLSNEELINILTVMMKEKKYIINDLQFNENKTGLIAKVSSNPTAHYFKYEQLSGGEKQRVLLEITLRIAIYYSRFTSTILLVEYTSFDIIDSAGINRLFEVVRDEDMDFQFFFTSIFGFNLNSEGFKTWLLEPSEHGNIVATADNIAYKT